MLWELRPELLLLKWVGKLLLLLLLLPGALFDDVVKIAALIASSVVDVTIS